jgi:hypothetical protein
VYNEGVFVRFGVSEREEQGVCTVFYGVTSGVYMCEGGMGCVSCLCVGGRRGCVREM